MYDQSVSLGLAWFRVVLTAKAPTHPIVSVSRETRLRDEAPGTDTHRRFREAPYWDRALGQATPQLTSMPEYWGVWKSG